MAYTVPKLENCSSADLASHFQVLFNLLFDQALAVNTEEEARNLRDTWLSRKHGIVTQLGEQLKTVPKERRREFGQYLNGLKSEMDLMVSDFSQFVKDKAALKGADISGKTFSSIKVLASKARLEADRVDVTLPGIHRPLGVEHPIVKASNEMVGIFKRMGYSVAEGPEVETDYYNFESLNFPPNHPARDTQDTIFIAGQESKPQRERLLLRTHTSPVQMRAMEQQRPPIRVVVPGKVHRHDTADASHSPLFHQIEGLAVDTNITFCDLKGTLDHAMKSFFGSSVKTRFYPSFFPFTEPSADVQISCFKCGGRGCRLCKMSGWIEVLGSGMVDPNVFEFVKHNGYDPARVSGFAFGMGVERIAMLKYGIDDIQLFFQGDVRFLEQFA